MIINKTDTTNPFDGCLNYFKDLLVFGLPPNKTWFASNNPSLLIGNPPGDYNICPDPWTIPPSYFTISFPQRSKFFSRFIIPTSYYIEGRRCCNNNFIKSWTLEGMNIQNEWKIIHQITNQPFSLKEPRIYNLSTSETFISFRFNMTEPDTHGVWALTIGQLDIFGYIYDYSRTIRCSKFYKCQFFQFFSQIFISFFLIISP
jgi:hypothetical protein